MIEIENTLKEIQEFVKEVESEIKSFRARKGKGIVKQATLRELTALKKDLVLIYVRIKTIQELKKLLTTNFEKEVV